MGNGSGWTDFEFKSNDEGIATHVFAAFHPSLEGEGSCVEFPPCYSSLTSAQNTTAFIYRTPILPIRGPRLSGRGAQARSRQRGYGS
jgi:hypothetical protein